MVVRKHQIQGFLPSEASLNFSVKQAARDIGGCGLLNRTCLISIKDMELWMRTSKTHSCDHTYVCLVVDRITVPFFPRDESVKTAVEVFGEQHVAEVKGQADPARLRDMQVDTAQKIRSYGSIIVSNLQGAHISLDKPGNLPAWVIQDLE